MPSSLAQTTSTPEGRAWLDRLPGLIERAVERWDLALDSPFDGGMTSWTAPARGRSGPLAGRDLVLKIGFPHDEARGEASALRLWRGRGAVRLREHDADDWALLLDRCLPGSALRDAGGTAAERLATAAAALRRLHDTSACQADEASFPDLGEVSARLADLLADRWAAARGTVGFAGPGDDSLVSRAVALMRELAAAESVVLHGDANPGNLLRADAEWVWIDPKPVRGDRAYDAWPLLWQVDDPFANTDPPEALAGTARTLATELGVACERVLAWSVARSVESALWSWTVLRDAGWAEGDIRRARLAASLLGS